jgi:hypothetical protein
MTPERYLVQLSPDHPQLGGFTYASLPAARRSLADTRRRWPSAELRVIPTRPKSPKGNPSPNTRRPTLCRP